MQTYQEILTKLAQALKLEELVPDEMGSCFLMFDENLLVEIRYNQERNEVLFLSKLGLVEEAQRTKIYEQLLEANLFWVGTAGATLGIDENTEVVTLTLKESLAHMEYERFEKLLESFVNALEYWLNNLAKWQKEQTGDAPTSTIEPHAI